MENVANALCVLLLVLIVGQNIYFRRQCKKLKDLAYKDPLTNLFTRRFLDLEIAKIYDNRPSQVAVMMLDVNNFKLINDNYGHLVGDKTLKLIAQAISLSVRPGDFVFRYAGDEFLICLPSASNPKDLESIVERIRSKVIVSCWPLKMAEQVSVSCGYAIRVNNETIVDLISLADKCMYCAKRGNRSAD